MTIKIHKQDKCGLLELVGAEYNPRTMPDEEMRNLMGSLRKHGIVQPVIARRVDKMILGGHQRIEAIKRIYAEEGIDLATVKVPVIWIDDISDADSKLLNVALNRIHGEWDYTKLGELFDSLSREVSAEALASSGFSEKEIEDIVKMTAIDPNFAGSELTEDEVDSQLAADKRKVTAELSTDEEAAEVKAALAAYGCTGPSNAAVALLKMARAAVAHVKCEEELCS